MLTQSCPMLWEPVDSSLEALSPSDFPGMDTRMGSHFFLQGIFPTQGLTCNPFVSCIVRQILLPLSYLGSPKSYWSIQAEDLNRHFSKEDRKMVKRHIERCSTSLIMRNTNQSHNDIPPHTCQTIIQKTASKLARRCDVKKRESSCTIGRIVNWCSHYGKLYEVSSKNQN